MAMRSFAADQPKTDRKEPHELSKETEPDRDNKARHPSLMHCRGCGCDYWRNDRLRHRKARGMHGKRDGTSL